jgi:hypothetical protein
MLLPAPYAGLAFTTQEFLMCALPVCRVQSLYTLMQPDDYLLGLGPSIRCTVRACPLVLMYASWASSPCCELLSGADEYMFAGSQVVSLPDLLIDMC